MAVGKPLAAIVRKVAEVGRLPRVPAGGCDASQGVLAGFDHTVCGVVWFDAHGDFNTPQTTITGYLPAMSMAVITGHCYPSYWAQMGDSTPIAESATLMLGLRDLDPAEKERLEHSPIQVVKWREGKPESEVRKAIDELARRVPEVYLHIDIDSLDSEVAPGVMLFPVLGGISLEDMNRPFVPSLRDCGLGPLHWQSMILRTTKTTRRSEPHCD